MKKTRIFSVALTVAALVLGAAGMARADTTPQTLPFAQDWSNTGLITTNDDWSGVPGIEGYRGDNLTGSNDVDPRTVLSEGTPVIDVNANQTDPNTFTTGGVAEFEITDPCVALQGSGTADAPSLVITVDTTSLQDITVSYNLRDIDGSADNATQQVALQFRVGTTGDYTDVPAGYVADASTGPSQATLVTPISVVLPASANARPVVQIRVITTNSSGSDEWIGVDDISITGSPGGTPTNAALTGAYTFNGNVVALFDLDPGAVAAGDFTLTGSQSLGFIGISGTGTERALTPASALTIGDATLDNLAVAATATTDASNVDFYVYPPISLIQDGTIPAGTVVGVQGTVTGRQTTQQEGSGQEYSIATASGAGNGLFVEDPTYLPSVQIGNAVDVAGLIAENFGVTTIVLSQFADKGLGIAISPVSISATDLLATNVSDTPPAEDYEGVLISVTGLTNAQDANFGETLFNEGVKLDGLFYDARAAGTIVDGLNYDVIGVGYFSFGEYKILPRQPSDLTQKAADDPDISAPLRATLGHTLNTVAKEKDIVVTNQGATQNLTISGATFSGTGAGKYSVVTNPLPTISPGNSAAIRVRFTPGGENGLFKATLNIASNDPSNASTPVELTVFSNPGPTVVINEFDTENFNAEYVELFNLTGSAIDLGADGYVLVFINGADNRVYQATGLTGTIPAFGFFLVAESGVSTIGSATVDQQAAWTSFQNGQDGIALVQGALETDFPAAGTYSTQLSGVAGAWQADGIIYEALDAELDFELGLDGIGIATDTGVASMRRSDGQGGPNDNYTNADWRFGDGTPGARNAPLAARSWSLYE